MKTDREVGIPQVKPAAEHSEAPAGRAIVDARPEAAVQRKLLERIDRSIPPLQRKTNKTGLPDNLKSGIENLSGLAMDDVRVHRNSDKPAQLNAHAYAQGTDIHVAPGQEKHLPHEAWHVVQQKQGRVKPTRQLKGKVAINDDAGLEREADVMGAKALRSNVVSPKVRKVTGDRASSTQLVQLVRQEIHFPSSEVITFELLQNAINPIDVEIAALTTTDTEEVTGGWIEMDKIHRWRAQFTTRLQALAALAPGTTAYSKTEVLETRTGVQGAMRSVIVTLGNLRGTLNQSLTGIRVHKEGEDALAAMKEASAASKELESEKRFEKAPPKKTPTKKPVIGVDGKWAKHRDQLKHDGTTKFIQWVPKGSKTVEAAGGTDLLSAVFHEGKAFWISIEGKYTIKDTAGKVKMVYTFSSSTAKSIVEDYLICGSGDYAEDNEEEWSGEADHPDYTIWKSNEIGAYGIGQNRLKRIASGCTKIEVFDK